MARASGTPRRGVAGRLLRGGLYVVWGVVVLWLVWQSLVVLSIGSGLWQGGVTLPQLRLWLNLWALAGAVGLAQVWRNRRGWTGGQRFRRSLIPLGLLLGRPLMEGVLRWAMVYAMPKQAGAVGAVLLLVLGPVVMSLVMILVMTLVAACVISAVGLLASMIFWIVVGVPVTLFNQILQFDRAIHIYRYRERGLIGYIVRFGYWLRGETPPPPPPDESRGARFATHAEMEALHAGDDASGFGFGYLES